MLSTSNHIIEKIALSQNYMEGIYIYILIYKYIYSIGNIATFIPVVEVISILKLLSLESKIKKTSVGVFFQQKWTTL